MDKVNVTLTVFFEEPFWVGVFQRTENGRLSATKVTFGAEPKASEIYGFILKDYYCLQFGPAVETAVKEQKRNPKRLQRDAKKQMQSNGIGTKSQQALNMQREQNKQERKIKSRAEKTATAKKMFELKQQKKREKHKGH